MQWPYFQPDSDLVRMYLDGVSRNLHLPATVAVNERKASSPPEGSVWG